MMSLGKWAPLKRTAIRLPPLPLSWMTEGDHTATGLKGKLRHNRREVSHVYGVQPYHWLICDALGLHHSWYEAPSAHKNGKRIPTP